MHNEIDMINKITIGSFFLLGMVIGSTITIIVDEFLKRGRE